MDGKFLNQQLDKKILEKIALDNNILSNIILKRDWDKDNPTIILETLQCAIKNNLLKRKQITDKFCKIILSSFKKEAQKTRINDNILYCIDKILNLSNKEYKEEILNLLYKNIKKFSKFGKKNAIFLISSSNDINIICELIEKNKKILSIKDIKHIQKIAGSFKIPDSVENDIKNNKETFVKTFSENKLHTDPEYKVKFLKLYIKNRSLIKKINRRLEINFNDLSKLNAHERLDLLEDLMNRLFTYDDTTDSNYILYAYFDRIAYGRTNNNNMFLKINQEELEKLTFSLVTNEPERVENLFHTYNVSKKLKQSIINSLNYAISDFENIN